MSNINFVELGFLGINEFGEDLLCDDSQLQEWTVLSDLRNMSQNELFATREIIANFVFKM